MSLPSFLLTAIIVLSILWLVYLVIMQGGIELPTPQLKWITLVPTLVSEFIIIACLYRYKASGEKFSEITMPYIITLIVGWSLLFKEYLPVDASKTLIVVSRLAGGLSLALLIALFLSDHLATRGQDASPSCTPQTD